MTDDRHEMVRAAHELDGERAANNDLYGRWVDTYDATMVDSDYLAPHLCALLVHQAAQTDSPAVLDMGCGTGLVGRELERMVPGATVIGADLSPEMAQAARATGAYQDAFGDVDLNEPLSDALGTPFDIVVCCGTFSLGHVGPDSVEHLIRATRPGGHAVFSVRRRHSQEHDFAGTVRGLRDRGLVEVETRLDNAPYIADEGADYWTLRVA